MTTIEWIIVSCSWLLIPAVLLLKRYIDKKQEKVWRETQPIIEVELKKIVSEL